MYGPVGSLLIRGSVQAEPSLCFFISNTKTHLDFKNFTAFLKINQPTIGSLDFLRYSCGFVEMSSFWFSYLLLKLFIAITDKRHKLESAVLVPNFILNSEQLYHFIQVNPLQ